MTDFSRTTPNVQKRVLSEVLWVAVYWYYSVIKFPIQDWQCSGTAWELRQTLGVVFDLYTSGQGKKGKGNIPFFFKHLCTHAVK